MKECTIVVKKVYETKKTKTVTERSVLLNEDSLAELCTLVIEHVYSVDNSSLHLLCEALREV